MRDQRPGWGALSSQLALLMQLPSCGHPGQAWGDSGGHTKAPGCRTHHGALTAGCQGPASQPCPAQVSLLPINLKSSSGWGPLSQLHALCPEASLSGGRCSGPGGVVRPKSGQEKGQGGGGQRNTTPTSKSFQIRG